MKVANKSVIYTHTIRPIVGLLLLALTLAKTCALQLCPRALAPRAGTCTSALHVQMKYILGEGQRDPNGK